MPYSRFPFPARLSARGWLINIGIWNLAALSLTLQFWLNDGLLTDWQKGISILTYQWSRWFHWIFLFPIIKGTCERWPLGSPFRIRNYTKNLAEGIVLLGCIDTIRVLCFNWDGASITVNFVKRFIALLISDMAMQFGIYSFVVIGLTLYQSEKQKSEHKQQTISLEKKLADAKFETVKMQLSPHFLFNALNTVSSLVRAKRDEEAIEVNERIAIFLRSVLDFKDSKSIPLEEELKWVKEYLQIELIRFRDRLNVTYDISSETLRVDILPFILQPIVENAIKHGLSKFSEPQILQIQSYINKENYFVLKVRNKSKPWNPLEQSEYGTGLTLVKRRLDEAYGTAAVFGISYNSESETTTVMLIHPKSLNQLI